MHSRRPRRGPGFRFFGNVEVGSTVSHEELLAIYDAVVYTVGAQTDRRLGVPGEDLPGSWPATAFVAWYNGHPDFQDLDFRPRLRAGRRDRERQRRDRLRPDARAHRGGAGADRHDRRGGRGDRRLAGSRDPHARPPRAGSGCVHAAGAEGARGAGRCGRPSSTRTISSSMRPARPSWRRTEIALDETSSCCRSTPRARRTAKPRRIVLRFLVSPVAILGDERVEAVEIVRNELVEEDGRIVARPTGETRDDPVRPRAAQRRVPRSRPAGCSIRRAARHDPERRAAVSTAPSGRMSPAGSSAARAASSARTRRTRPRRSSSCSRTRAPERLAVESTEGLEELLDRERACTLRRVRRLAGDRRGRARRRRAARAAARKLTALGCISLHDGRVRTASLRERRDRHELALDTQRRAVGRRDAQGDRQLPRLRRADPGVPSRAGSAGSRPPPRASNAELGLLDADKAQRIAAAGDRIAAGELDDQFPIDVFQTGSGTSSNTNANEVIATLAGEDVHPNDDVNMGQSSNDVFPSAVHLAALEQLTADLLPALDGLGGGARGEGGRVRRHRQVRAARTGWTPSP